MSAKPQSMFPACSAEDLEQQQDLELPADIMHDLQEEAIVMSRMRVGPWESMGQSCAGRSVGRWLCRLGVGLACRLAL